jgi:hypothetical protein
MTCEKLKWVADILSRVRGKLADHRDTVSHSESHKVREILAEVDAAAIIMKEKRNEHTDGTKDCGTDPVI